MSSFCKCKSYSHFFTKNNSIYAIFNDQSFNDTLTNDIVSFEQLGLESSLEAYHEEYFFHISDSNGQCHAKTYLWAYADREGPDQPAHSCRITGY